jgi:predicted phosphodiesterase
MHRINTIIRVLFVLFIWVTYSSAEDIRFAVIADHRDYFAGLENALEFIDSQNVDFIIVAGDFDPTDEGYVNYYSAHGYAVESEQQPNRQKVYFVLGNHDSSPSGDVYFEFNIAPYYPTNGPDSAPKGTIFSFDRGDSHFVVTNQYWNYSSGGYIPQQLDWIENDLASTQKPFKFVIGHEPAFPQFRHVGDSLDADPQMREDFWQILSDNHVTAYICGHTHHIYSDLVDGVYQLDAGEAREDSLDVIIVEGSSTVVTAHLFSTNGSVPTANDEFETIVIQTVSDKDNVPDQPSNLSATAMSATQINLNWSDNSTNELGFKIERKVSGGIYSKIAEVGADATSYSDTQCNEATTYAYRVRASNAAGDSIFSNDASATTPSAGGGGGGSQDDVEDFVTRFYQLCLGRNPDQTGLDVWVVALLNGTQTGSGVAYGFVFSQEFLGKNTSNEDFLFVLYEAFLNRKPDAAGMQGWLSAIENGDSRENVLNGFIYSSEFVNLCDQYGIKAFDGHIPKAQREAVETFVTRFYQLCLGRDPDAAGLEDWVNNLLNQIQTGADVADGFIYSHEFINKHTSNDEYLTILYKAFLDRAPDKAGWGVWIAELNNGKDRGYVLNGFLGSQEFIKLCEDYGINPF